jgi:hypothetical protein
MKVVVVVVVAVVTDGRYDSTLQRTVLQEILGELETAPLAGSSSEY